MPLYSPEPSAQAVSSLAYTQTTTAVVATTLPLVPQAKSNFVGASKQNSVEYYLSFNPLAIAQVSTLTVTATSPTAADTIVVTFTDGSIAPKTRVLQYTVQAGDSAADVIEILLALINMSPYAFASTVSTTSPFAIVVNSVVPGQAHTIAVTKVGTSLTVSATAIATPASGVVNYGKIFVADLNVSTSTDSDAYFQVGVTLQSFDGAQPVATSSSGVVSFAPQKHAKSIKALRIARGV